MTAPETFEEWLAALCAPVPVVPADPGDELAVWLQQIGAQS